jgi:DNA uptake protein ComE-like DNA-binding protein
MKGWNLFTPAERRLSALLFALAVLGEVAHAGRGISPQVAAWLDGAPPRPVTPPDTARLLAPFLPRAEGPSPAPKTASPSASPPAARIDPNVADLEALVHLPGVGPVLARRILEDRAQHGVYHRPEDLLRVPGIGPAKLAKLRPHLVLDGKPGG